MKKTNVNRRCHKKEILFPQIFVWIMVLVMFSSAQQLRASGFAIFEIGARAAALAGAYVAQADDASAIYYN
ncbi:MAG: hypothetical protein MUP70_00305, partial [Candidatus Aminicenantes bacterium]|nr:hypothetical protein [Candidatus Aminicenantes bacterium]